MSNTKIDVKQAHHDVKAGDALSICVYENQATKRTMKLAALLGFFMACCMAGSVRGQTIVQPTTVYYPPAATVYSPPAPPAVAAPSYYRAPTTSYYRAPTTVRVAPAPVYLPAVTTVARPVVGYSPAVTYPPVAPVVVPARPVVVGRGILGGPEAYVPGQPIRNTLRFVLP